jgi:hypothetical protein
MGWNLEGAFVQGNYCGDISVSGVVTLSRVAYGGRVEHHIELEHGINWQDKIVRPKGDTIILDNDALTSVKEPA